MKQVQKKLRSRRAMTLTEVLVAVIILSFVTLGVAAGVNASLRVYRQSVAVSDAQTLSSTLSIAMMDELRYARDVEGTAAPTFTSAARGAGVTFGTNGNGQITLGGEPLVGEGAYAGLTAGLSAFTYDAAAGFSVTLTISDSAGDEIRTIDFSVRPLND